MPYAAQSESRCFKLERKMTPKQIKTQARKDLVYKTAIDLFLSQGYRATTMRQISETSGVSIGSIYHFYENKESILTQLGATLMITNGIARLSVTEENLADPITTVILYYVDVAKRFQQIGPELTHHLQMQISRVWQNPDGSNNDIYIVPELVNFIAEAQKRGKMDASVSPLETARMLQSASEGILGTWFLQNGSFPLAEYAEEFMTRFARSFAV